MIDDRMLRAFGELDQPVAPDPEFARVLYERLVSDLGLRARPGVIARVMGRVGVRPRSVPHVGSTPRLRLAFAAVVVGVAVVAGGALFAATSLPPVAAPTPSATPTPTPTPSPSPSPSPQGDAAAAELVRLSQAAYRNPPAVTFTLPGQLFPQPTIVSSDGRGTWWTRPADSSGPGDYMLYDGRRVGIYESIIRSWSTNPVEQGGPPYPMNDAFNWVDISFPELVATMKTLDCSDAVSLGETVVAGRTADRVRCPGLQLEYALDRETHLVLRLVADYGTRFWGGSDATRPSVVEVADFRVGVAADQATFDWSGPQLAERAPGPIEGTKMSVGTRPPEWSGTTIDGKAFSTKSLTGPSAILFLCLDCTSGAAAYERFSRAVAAHPGIRAVVVGQTSELGTLTGYVKDHPVDATVISDPNSEFPTAWGYPYLGGLVILGTGGRVGDVLSARISTDDYDRVLTAAEQGRPIPAPVTLEDANPAASAPPASASPGASAATPPECGGDLVVCHAPGWTAPAWSGTMPDGSRFDSAALAGKPAVIWFGDIQSRTSIAALAALGKRYAGRANVVMITSREATPGETAALLQTMGVQLPVVLDWDGSIGRSFITLTWGSVLLDADGRLVTQSTGVDDPALLRELDGLLAPAS